MLACETAVVRVPAAPVGPGILASATSASSRGEVMKQAALQCRMERAGLNTGWMGCCMPGLTAAHEAIWVLGVECATSPCWARGPKLHTAQGLKGSLVPCAAFSHTEHASPALHPLSSLRTIHPTCNALWMTDYPPWGRAIDAARRAASWAAAGPAPPRTYRSAAPAAAPPGS
jgi:hypothetical protein